MKCAEIVKGRDWFTSNPLTTIGEALAIALLLMYYATPTLSAPLPRFLSNQSTQKVESRKSKVESVNKEWSPAPKFIYGEKKKISDETRSARHLSQVMSNRLAVDVPVATIARQVTVRILGNPGMGSGAIIQRQGQTYTVVTCAHVVAESQDHRYSILTADGQTHNGRRLRSIQFADADLALVQFTSSKAYRVAAIADSSTQTVGDPVYASGFPSWYWTNSNNIEDTRNWGTKAFRLTTGKLAMLPEQSLQEGYQLGYTNEIEQGMSGGPVLDHSGRLIGINGRLKYPPQGIVAFIFADGTTPPKELFQQMEALSWAVPSTTFRQALSSKK